MYIFVIFLTIKPLKFKIINGLGIFLCAENILEGLDKISWPKAKEKTMSVSFERID